MRNGTTEIESPDRDAPKFPHDCEDVPLRGPPSLYGESMVCSDDYGHSLLHTCRISATWRKNRSPCPARDSVGNDYFKA